MEKDIENVYSLIKSYRPSCEQEKQDKEFMLWCVENMNDLLTRKNDQFHFTASAFVINQTHKKVLAIYHNIYDSWSFVGGHADGMKVMQNVALKEAKEETSLKELKMLNGGAPISIEKLLVEQHYKGEKLVYEHYHLNLTFLLEANDQMPLVIKTDENSDIKWMTFDEFLESVSEPKMLPIYQKIIDKIKNGI